MSVLNKKRWLSVDVFRGMTVVLMIIVNSPGNQTAYPLLEHAVWNGCTLADLVFPFFIFIVGMSVVLSHPKHASLRSILPKLLFRTTVLFSIGLLLNAFPKHFDLATLRIPGVLQRIAICYFFATVMYLTTRVRTQAITMVLLLVGYCWVMGRDFSIEGNFAGYVDRLIFSSHHMYTHLCDPEGLLSTLPALATVLLGNLLGICLISGTTPQKFCICTIIIGIVTLILGWLCAFVFPINKSLWSSSYVLWTGGLTFLSYAVCYWWIEIKKWRIGTGFFELFGTNALLIYVLHVFFLKIQASILLLNAQGDIVSLRLFLTNYLFGKASFQNASLLYALSYVFVWWMFLVGISRLRTRSSKRVSVV